MEQLDYRVVNFVHLLRVLGIRVSVAETLDAIKALTYADIASRIEVKAVLRATLLKNMDQLPLFEQAFQGFFSLPEEAKYRREQRQEQDQVQAEAMAQAEAELTYQGEQLDLSIEQKQLYNKLTEVEKKKIQGFLEKSSNGQRNGEKLDSNFKPIVENLVRGQLDYWKRLLGEELPLFDVIPTGNEDLDELVREVSEDLRKNQGNYLYEDLKNIQDKDLDKVNNLIRKLTRRLASKISRRYHKSKRISQLDLRRTIRASLSYGGTLVDLKYKSKSKSKPRFLLLCDVSGSMARYASFVLQFTYGLSSVLKGIESFVFSEDLERVTDKFSRGLGFEQTMVEVMNKSGEWGGGTNLARALESLRTIYPALLTKDTVMIIVSDTKTLEVNRAVNTLKTMSDGVKDVLWLNTLPRKQWSQHKGVKQFTGVAKMFECYTLSHLERIMSTQLK
jgi:uncharacterized protein